MSWILECWMWSWEACYVDAVLKNVFKILFLRRQAFGLQPSFIRNGNIIFSHPVVNFMVSRIIFEHWSCKPHPQGREAFGLHFSIIPLCFAVDWQCASNREQGGFLLWRVSLPGVCKGCCDCHPSLGNKMGYRWAPYLMSVGIKCQFTMASNFSMTEWLIRWVLAVGYLRSPCGTCDNVIVLFWWTKDGVIINDDTTLGVFFMATTTLFFSLPQTA